MHVAPRPAGAAAIRKIVLHLNAGPEQEGGAGGLLHYLQTIDAGYHEIIDNKVRLQVAQPDQIVWAASGMNTRGYHICLIGNVQTAEQWHDTYSRGELDLAARSVAQRCHDFSLPPTHLDDPQVADTEARGVCDHWAVNRAIVKPANARGDHSMGPGDHVDVGPGFPWAEFMAAVVRAYGGAPAPVPVPTPPTASSDEEDARMFINPRAKNPLRPQYARLDRDRRHIVLSGGGQLAGHPGQRIVPVPTSGVPIDGWDKHPDGLGFTVADHQGHGFVYRWA